jgi:hypothetical protein
MERGGTFLILNDITASIPIVRLVQEPAIRTTLLEYSTWENT